MTKLLKVTKIGFFKEFLVQKFLDQTTFQWGCCKNFHFFTKFLSVTVMFCKLISLFLSYLCSISPRPRKERRQKVKGQF